MKLWVKNITAIILGVIVGIIFKEQVVYFKIIGDLFINTLKMISVPLIFFILIKTFNDFNKKSNIKQLIRRSITVFTMTGLLAIFFASVITFLALDNTSLTKLISGNLNYKNFNMAKIVVHLFPTNFLRVFLEDKMLQVVIMSVFIAYTLFTSPKKSDVIIALINETTELLLRMLEIIIQITPYALFAFSAWLSGSLDVNMIVKFSKLFYIILITYLLLLIILSLYMTFVIKVNPFKFFIKSLDYQSFSFGTGSSKASLSFTINQAVIKLGISPRKANLIIPLGASVNMTGLAIYLVASTIFLADFFNIELGLMEYLVIFSISFVSPIGAAGLSGGALLIMPLILSSVGIPSEAFVLMVAIDPIINGFRTAMNITGDVAVALIIDKQDNELNENIYNQ